MSLPWYVSLLLMIAKPLVIAGLKALEAKYPGITPIIDEIIKLIEGGMPASQIQAKVRDLASE